MSKTKTTQMTKKVILPQTGSAVTNVISSSRFTGFKVKLLKALEEKNIWEGVEKLCHKENKSLREQYDSLTTLRRYYTYYRNICREIVPKKLLGMCLDIFNLTFEEMLLLKAQYAKKVSTEHRSLRPLRNPDKMILTALDLLEGVSVYDRILGLSFLSGRRVAEIACTAKFQTLRKEWMLFDGQLKIKEKLSGTYEIPVLAQPSLIVEGIRQIRAERPQWVDQPIPFHDRGSPALSVRVKKHFSAFIDTPTVKDLRAAYAEICYDRFASVRISKSRFFSDILGHGQDDNLTGQSYIDFYIEEAA
jgi:Telomere resolvase